MNINTILIVEDDKEIRQGVEIFLKGQGYRVLQAENGLEGLKVLEQETVDLAIVDVMMPRMDGITMVIKLREKYEFPVIFLSAKSEEVDKIMGLNMGADDYIVKPFSPAELVARVHSHIKIHERLLEEKRENQKSVIQIDDIAVYPGERRVYKNEEEIFLTNKEFELLLFFIENPNIVFSKDALFDRIWGMDSAGSTATVTVHINRLREKIEKDVSDPRLIETVWGAGYRFKLR